MVIEQAKEVLRMEAEAINALIPRIGSSFAAAVEMMLGCEGRIVVTGMGKSGLIGQKIAATLASTGTPAFFLHPAEGVHGDLGMVTAKDIVVALSNSGETDELINILPVLKRIGARIIAMTGRAQSTLAKNADIFLDVGVEKEACPLGLAPTASTTAALALGDALAVALLSERKFTPEEFALFHPGGSLGRKLLLTVEKLMHGGAENPVIAMDKTLKEALFIITSKGLGATSVIDERGKLVGIVTDGDIRRSLEKGYDVLSRPLTETMTRTPKTITPEKLAAQALQIMESNKPRPITVLPVIDQDKHPVGMLHLTDLLKAGVV